MNPKRKLNKLDKSGRVRSSLLVGAAAHFEKSINNTLPEPVVIEMHPDMVRDGKRVARAAQKVAFKQIATRPNTHHTRNATSAKVARAVTAKAAKPTAKVMFVPEYPTNTDAHRRAKNGGAFLVKYPDGLTRLVKFVRFRDTRDYIAARRDVRNAIETYFDNSDARLSDAERAQRWLMAVVAELDKNTVAEQSVQEEFIPEMGMNAILFSVEYSESIKDAYLEEYRKWVEKQTNYKPYSDYEYRIKMHEDFVAQEIREMEEILRIVARIDATVNYDAMNRHIIDRAVSATERKEQRAEKLRKGKQRRNYAEWLERKMNRRTR